MYSPASTRRHIRECFTEFSLGRGVYSILTFGNGRWSLIQVGGPEDYQRGGPVKTEYQALLRIGSAWHRWWADGSSASGYSPDCVDCLGDVVSSDSQLKRYEDAVASCPSTILAKVNVR